MGVDFSLIHPRPGKAAARALQRLAIPDIEARFAADHPPLALFISN
jgi:hypothetical protein